LQDDSVITLDEWYHYFETIAQQDPGCDDGDAATSLEVAQEITFLEKQAGMLAKPKVVRSLLVRKMLHSSALSML